MPPYLDHIVILLPHAKLLSLPSWIPNNFVVAPGGRHADGRTENKLITFRDGSYIELISFIGDDPKLREGHGWGDRQFGIIDFAFTHLDLDPDANCDSVNERLSLAQSKVRYQKPVPGGRKRDDGQVVKWKVTLPSLSEAGDKFQRGELPFFCHDVTSRSLRVPAGKENVRHPTGAYGIKSISVFAPEERVAVLVEAYKAILDTPNLASSQAGPNRGAFEVQRMNRVEGTKGGITVYVQAPTADLQERGGVLLGDIVGGGLSPSGGKGRVRIDVPLDDGVGRIFLDLDVPVDE